MPSTYELVVLDIDGTTTASKGDALPSQRVINAVKEAQKSVHIAVATGRAFSFAKLVTDALGLHGPSVFNGGAEIVDVSSGETLYRELLPIETVREVIELLLPFGLDIYADSDQYSEPIRSPEQVDEPAAKLFIDAIETHRAMQILEELTGVPGASAHPTTSWTDGDVVDIHVTHEHATKRHGVEKLMAILGCEKEEVMAIGDGHNDLPMLEAAGFKVAMGNAPPEVKAVADYIAPSLEDDGVAEAIERFILK
ncbi:MAG TPA: HAD family hydrolase [Candidatus Saccharimonadales bacterium]|nr:HAD family hydrolase [Candidatus Saccharimonadales bacterium]